MGDNLSNKSGFEAKQKDLQLSKLNPMVHHNSKRREYLVSPLGKYQPSVFNHWPPSSTQTQFQMLATAQKSKFILFYYLPTIIHIDGPQKNGNGTCIS
jgi:hypothetical protein